MVMRITIKVNKYNQTKENKIIIIEVEEEAEVEVINNNTNKEIVIRITINSTFIKENLLGMTKIIINIIKASKTKIIISQSITITHKNN